jgi:transcriptional regulator with XRE-family HTH domain
MRIRNTADGVSRTDDGAYLTDSLSPADVGGRLRAVRLQHGLSQRELAKRAGLTHSTISLIEQNRVSPSVGSLKKILDSIPITLSEFFAEGMGDEAQIFYHHTELVELASGKISYRQVGRHLKGRALQILHERLAPGADTGEMMLQHNAEEGGVIVRGALEVTVGTAKRVLKPGDAYYFNSNLPHRFRNVGDEECELVSACTPPSF